MDFWRNLFDISHAVRLKFAIAEVVPLLQVREEIWNPVNDWNHFAQVS